ncbi:acylphosphatase, partial [bacterium]|nr:acylphosphatase [bacterium]
MVAGPAAGGVTGDGAIRRRLRVDGIVQGVGFRPFVYNLAHGLGLAGEVSNTSAGVVIAVQGPATVLDEFARRLMAEAPPLARITSLQAETVPPDPTAADFVIVASADTPGTSTLIPPDVATCADCLREIRD